MGKTLKVVGKFLIGKVLYRVKEYNKPDLTNGEYILCPNHVSDADGPVMWTHNENIRILAKKECFKHKFMAVFLNMIDVVKIDRDSHNGVELLEAIDYFKDGKNKLSRIKSGAFFISAKTNVPIVPVFLEQPRLFKRTRVVYGRPMYMEGAVGEDGKVDKKALEKYRLQWQQEVFKLQDMAVKYENRPIRKLKLKPKHQNNNE